MQKFAVRAPDDNNQKTPAQRTREAGLPATHQKKSNWPFLVADTPAIGPDRDASQPVRPS